MDILIMIGGSGPSSSHAGTVSYVWSTHPAPRSSRWRCSRPAGGTTYTFAVPGLGRRHGGRPERRRPDVHRPALVRAAPEAGSSANPQVPRPQSGGWPRTVL